MNLISCTCGIVLDEEKLVFPSNILRQDREIDLEKADWNGYKYVPYVKCPCCNAKILKND